MNELLEYKTNKWIDTLHFSILKVNNNECKDTQKRESNNLNFCKVFFGEYLLLLGPNSHPIKPIFESLLFCHFFSLFFFSLPKQCLSIRHKVSHNQLQSYHMLTNVFFNEKIFLTQICSEFPNYSKCAIVNFIWKKTIVNYFLTV